MLSVEEAQERILAGRRPLAAEDVALDALVGRVLAADLVAPLDLPPFANSAMDGYAVRAEDLTSASEAAPVALRLIGAVPAGGVFAGEVLASTTVRIFTGAPLPLGADAVLQQELTAIGATPDTVLMRASLTVGTNVRAAGSDLAAGTRLLARGATVDTPAIALCAAAGFATISVTRRPRVAIVSTGDELRAQGSVLGPGQIYDSNSPMLAAAVRAAGGEPIILPVARDTEDAIRASFIAAHDIADLILTSGGVSVGDYDLVRTILTALGAVDFWRVNVRPGKPLAFGTIDGVPVIGLPGNPVSSAVTFELFARPLIRTLLGAHDVQREAITVVLGTVVQRGDRRHYVRARLSYTDGHVIAHPTGDQGSHRIASLLDAKALVVIAEGTGDIPAGTVVPALLLS